ncbi:MAG: HEAT repeat domain-containing protein [Armatimonadetes bacterium]|jgi:hypothetical protein|nr:HEAT repeat domain-containing protein [Armatimonadota bacterium]
MALGMGTHRESAGLLARRGPRAALALLLLVGAMGAYVVQFRPPRLMQPLRVMRAKARAAAQEFAVTRDPRTAALLEKMAPQTNEGAAARDGLVRLGPPVVRAVIRRLQHEDPDMRAAAALVLGRLGDLRAVPALCRALDDPEAMVRFRAAYALGVLKERTAAPLIAQLLVDPSPDVVNVAIRALEECHCKVQPRAPLPGYRIRPWGRTTWQEIVPPDSPAAPATATR